MSPDDLAAIEARASEYMEWRTFATGDRVRVHFSGECFPGHLPDDMLDGETGTVLWADRGWPRGHYYAVHPDGSQYPEWTFAMLAAVELELIDPLA